jgi:hypothetical protein
MGRALSRSLAVVALLAVVSATLVAVTPSLARIAARDPAHPSPRPTWLWESHVYGGPTATGPAAKPQPKTTATPNAKHRRRRYTPPVERSSQP